MADEDTPKTELPVIDREAARGGWPPMRVHGKRSEPTGAVDAATGKQLWGSVRGTGGPAQD